MYATVDEANNYVQAYFSSTDPLRIAWEDLSDENRGVALSRASQQLDFLPLKGKPETENKAFPRSPQPELSLERAKQACIELAVHGLDEDAKQRSQLIQQGVASYRLGDLSETFRKTGESASQLNEILRIVTPYLKPWLSGGYRIENRQKDLFRKWPILI